tara:strand:- start:169 stop:321 length:153 start_codon:yes stop_codon:yes gene_type:complete
MPTKKLIGTKLLIIGKYTEGSIENRVKINVDNSNLLNINFKSTGFEVNKL